MFLKVATLALGLQGFILKNIFKFIFKNTAVTSYLHIVCSTNWVAKVDGMGFENIFSNNKLIRFYKTLNQCL